MPPMAAGSGKNALTFDAGGVSALSELIILRAFLHRLKAAYNLPDVPLACEYFDIMGGSGMGGVLIILLGRLRLDIDVVFNYYDRLENEAFARKKWWFLQDSVFSATLFEKVMGEIVERHCGRADARMIDDENQLGRCKVMVVARTADAIGAGLPTCIRTYRVPANQGPDCTIVEAVRATTAVPGMFERAIIQEQGVAVSYIGGALECNNPTGKLLADISAVFPDRPIASVISIGSGQLYSTSVPKSRIYDAFLPSKLLPAVQAIATDCERMHQDLSHRFEHLKHAYFRFNTEHSMQEIDQSSAISASEVQAYTRNYLLDASVSTRMDQAVKAAAERVGVVQFMQGIFQLLRQPNLRIGRCPPPSQDFTGRGSILEMLRLYFFHSSPVGQRRFVLHGPGGAGKTQLALKFAQLYKEYFWDVFYIDATTDSTVSTGLVQIARAAQVGETKQEALAWLASQEHRWLVVFRNADDRKFKLSQYFPACAHGNILITTGNQLMCAYARGAESDCQVSGMQHYTAVDLLLKILETDEHYITDELAGTLVEALNCFPLAIVQAGAYMRVTQCRVTEYLKLLRSFRERTLREPHVVETDDYGPPTYFSWEISYEKIKPRAAQLLHMLSFLHHEGISEYIFEVASGQITSYEPYIPLSDAEDATRVIVFDFLSLFRTPSNDWDPLALKDLTENLSSFSLLDYEPHSRTYSMHPLAQEWCRTISPDAANARACAAWLLALSVNWEFDFHSCAFRRQLLPHLLALDSKDGSLPFEFAQNLALVYHEAGYAKECEALMAIALQATRDMLGNEHSNTLIWMRNLVSLFLNQGRLDEAAAQLAKLIEVQKRVRGEAHPDTLYNIHELAVTYYLQGRWQESEALILEVIEVRQRVIGAEDGRTLASVGVLASTYCKQGRFSEAEALLVEVLDTMQKVLGESHPDTLMAMHNLASTYEKQGKLQEAQSLMEDTVAQNKLVHGESPQWTQLSLRLNGPDRSPSFGAESSGAPAKPLILRQRINRSGKSVYLSRGSSPPASNTIDPIESMLEDARNEERLATSPPPICRQISRRFSVLVEEEGQPAVRYALGSCISKGQFGLFYDAVNTTTGQLFAVKQLALDGLEPEEIQNLKRECDLLKNLSHPSILKCEGMAQDEEYLSIVLEYVENWPPDRTLKILGKLNEKLVASYVIRILEALQYLHKLSIVHCDLKAANILTTMNWNVKLSGFGVSLNLNAMEKANGVVGTPNWMAPEVIELKGASTKCDIWSLGCVIIELLTGRPPYDDIPDGPAVMSRIMEDESPPVPEGLSPALRDFLELCFRKDPDCRPNAAILYEHPWLQQKWGVYKEVRPQNSEPFLRRASAEDLRRFDSVDQLAISMDTSIYSGNAIDDVPRWRSSYGMLRKEAQVLLQLLVFLPFQNLDLLKKILIQAQRNIATYQPRTLRPMDIQQHKDRINTLLLMFGLTTAGSVFSLRLGSSVRDLTKRFMFPLKGNSQGLRPVVHMWANILVTDWLFDEATAVYLLAVSIGPEAESAIECRNFRSQLEPLVDIVLRSCPDTCASHHSTFLLVYEACGRWREVIRLQELMLEKCKLEMSQRGAGIAYASSCLSKTYCKVGRWRDAKRVQSALFSHHEITLGEADPNTLSTMYDLAFTFSRLGQWEKAESLQERVCEGRKQALGESHPDYLSALYSLASTYFSQGRWREAQELHEQALEARRQTLGEQHADTLSSMHSLATKHWEAGQSTHEAEEANKQVLEARKSALGPEHPDTLSSMFALALVYRRQGHSTKAAELAAKVLEIQRELFGRDHIDTIQNMRSLASWYYEHGRLSNAANLHAEILESRRAVYGDNSPETLASMDELVSTYWKQGLSVQAESLHLELLETRKRAFGDDDPTCLATSLELATHYLSQCQWRKASVLLREVLEIKRQDQEVEQDDPETADIKQQLDLTLFALSLDVFVISPTVPMESVVAHFTGSAGLKDYTSQLREVPNLPTAPIARGGFAEVYKVILQDGRELAVKCLKNTEGEHKQVKRTIRELSAWSELRHKCVAPLLGLALFRGQLAMVSPWSKRGSVMDFIKAQTSLDRYDLCAQVVDAVVYLHQLGVVHGDLKGANILVSDDETLQLTDFGLAIMRDTTIRYSKNSNQAGGTLRWMAPELLGGNETGGDTTELASRSLQETITRAKESEDNSGITLSKETDIYALGMTMLELMTGRQPFNEIQKETAVIFALAQGKRPRRPKEISDKTPQGTPFWNILQRCWAQTPADRPTANQVKTLISQIGTN